MLLSEAYDHMAPKESFAIFVLRDLSNNKRLGFLFLERSEQVENGVKEFFFPLSGTFNYMPNSHLLDYMVEHCEAIIPNLNVEFQPAMDLCGFLIHIQNIIEEIGEVFIHIHDTNGVNDVRMNKDSLVFKREWFKNEQNDEEHEVERCPECGEELKYSIEEGVGKQLFEKYTCPNCGCIV